MKKFGKFLLTTLSIAACVGGAYYFVKNILNKDADDDFDDFEDDFDDFDLDEEETEDTGKAAEDDRGYVTLNFSETEKEEKAAPEEPAPLEENTDKEENVTE